MSEMVKFASQVDGEVLGKIVISPRPRAVICRC